MDPQLLQRPLQDLGSVVLLLLLLPKDLVRYLNNNLLFSEPLTYSVLMTGTATNTGFGTGTNTGFGAAVAPSTGFGTAAGTNTGFGLGTGTNTGFGTGTTTSTGFGAGFGSTFGPTSNPAPSFNFNPPATTTQSLFSGFGQTQTNPSGGKPYIFVFKCSLNV